MPNSSAAASACFRQLATFVGDDLDAGTLIRVHDTIARFAARDRQLQARLLRPLSHLQVEFAARPRLELMFAAASPAVPDLPWTQARAAGDFYEWSDGDFVFSRFGDDLAVTGLDVKSGRGFGYVREPDRLPDAFFSGLVFTLLYQALRPHGYYLLHAAALAWGERGVLITGPSGAGKTTTMLQCVRAGFKFIADDATLLTGTTDDALLAVSTLNTMHVTGQTIALFPELARFGDAGAANGKVTIFLPEVYRQSVLTAAPPCLLIVPSLRGPRDGSFEVLSGRTVLSEALPLSVDLRQPDHATRHLDMLARLVSSVPCFRLHLPPDITSVPHLISTRLDQMPVGPAGGLDG